MASYVFCPKGTAFKMPVPGSGSKDFYYVKGLSGKTSANGAVLITNISDTESDVISKVLTLTDKKVLYKFNRNFGGITIEGRIVLGNMKTTSGDLSTVTDWFTQNRITAGGKPTGVSYANSDSGKLVYPVSMRHSAEDLMHHILRFEIDCVTVSKK